MISHCHVAFKPPAYGFEMHQTTAYMICTAPRSGSTLLCRMLAATGIAGDPESLFFGPSVQAWATSMGVDGGTSSDCADLQAIMQAALAMGRGDTPVFALRQQRPSFAYLCQKLAVLHPGAATDGDRIEQTFGPMRYVHLSRGDKLGQAVSYLKAQQTGLWHLAADGSELERTAPPRPPEYDRALIRDRIATLTAYDQGWRDWFKAQGITPIRVTYEELSEAPVQTLRRVLEDLDLDPSAAGRVNPGTRKMADATSRAWIERYRADTAAG
jgi:LPS sulfotransferase NodH